MKLKIYTIITFIFLGFKVNAQWVDKYIGSDSTDNIKGVSFFSPSSGYVAFSKSIGYTTDSGQTYTKYTISTANTNFNGYTVGLTLGFLPQGIKAFSKDTLFIFGHFSFEPSILYSANGGVSWKLVYHKNININANVYSEGVTDLVFPANGNTAYGVHHEGILRSLNRGQTWVEIYSAPSKVLRKLSFPNALSGYAIGGANMYKTTSSGTSWTAITLPNSTATINYNNLFFTAASVGYITDYISGSIFRTINSGVSWTSMSNPSIQFVKGSDLYFTNDSTGFLAQDYSYDILRTNNYGKTWETCKRNSTHSYLLHGLNVLSFYNNQYAWAGGDAEYLQMTNSGAITTLPKALFKADTTGFYATNKVNLYNYSNPGYQCQWFVNGVLNSTSFNSSYFHKSHKSIDTINLIVSNGIDNDTLTNYLNINYPMTVDSFMPKYVTPGTIVTIYGYGFSGVTNVTLSGKAATILQFNDTIILAEVNDCIVGNDGLVVKSLHQAAFGYGVICCPFHSVANMDILASATTICTGNVVNFYSVSQDVGNSPVYQWYRNGIKVGQNHSVYSDNNFNNNDSVYCIVSGYKDCYLPQTIKSSIVHLKVNKPPTVSLVSSSVNNCLGNDSLIVNDSGIISNLRWYNNTTLVKTTFGKVANSGTTVAGNGTSGTNKNQLNRPWGVKVDNNGNVYVTDNGNNRVMRFPRGSDMNTNGTILAEPYSSSTTYINLKNPTGIVLDDSCNIYVSNAGLNLIQKYPATTAHGIVGLDYVVGGTTSSSLFSYPSGICLDSAKNLYVVDNTNARILKFPPNSNKTTVGTIVAGGNKNGSNANQLNLPQDVFVDKKGYIYVADAGNNRIQRFPPGSTKSTNGVTVCGGNGRGSASNQLNDPRGVFVDTMGNIYVSELLLDRVQMFTPNNPNGIIVAGNNSYGNKANQLNQPTGISVDKYGNIYIADIINNRIQKWGVVVPSNQYSYKPVTPGSYTAIITDTNGCVANTNPIVFNQPDSPKVNIIATSNPSVINEKILFSIKSINTTNTNSYVWYRNSTIVGYTATYSDSTLQNGDSIWCVCVSSNSCIINDTIHSDTIIMKVSGTGFMVSGNIFNVQGYNIQNTNIAISGDMNYNLFLSNNLQYYLAAGFNYILKPTKNNDINKTNGVTTLDLALTQSHILGKNKLNKPYKIIAADVNGDGKITTLDLVYMKRLILGIDTTFTNSTTKENRLWAFVDSSYQFPDTTNPFPFKDSISYIGLNANKTNQTFIGVKLGDVNWDWNPALARMPSKVFVRPKKISGDMLIK